MSKKTFFIRLSGIMVFSIFFITATSYSDQYYDQYPGVGFVPTEETANYTKHEHFGNLNHNDTDDMYYCCPVTFNVPDGSIYFIKSIGMHFYDNLTDGYIQIELIRRNLYTAACQCVAIWNSGYSEAYAYNQKASKGTESGYKLVDTKKFSYWLYVRFYRDGDTNPGANLVLSQVRIHYGT